MEKKDSIKLAVAIVLLLGAALAIANAMGLFRGKPVPVESTIPPEIIEQADREQEQMLQEMRRRNIEPSGS